MCLRVARGLVARRLHPCGAALGDSDRRSEVQFERPRKDKTAIKDFPASRNRLLERVCAAWVFLLPKKRRKLEADLPNGSCPAELSIAIPSRIAFANETAIYRSFSRLSTLDCLSGARPSMGLSLGCCFRSTCPSSKAPGQQDGVQVFERIQVDHRTT